MHSYWENKLVLSLWRMWQCLTQVHIHLYVDPAALPLRIYLKEDTSQQYKHIYAQGYSIAAL